MVHSFLDHLSDVERVLKYGVLPEEEEALLAFRTCHQVWTYLLLQKTTASENYLARLFTPSATTIYTFASVIM